MVEWQTQVAMWWKWRPQRSGEESATAPWIARVKAHCTCTLHSWDLMNLKKCKALALTSMAVWRGWTVSFPHWISWSTLDACYCFSLKKLLVCTKAVGWASSFIDRASIFVRSILIHGIIIKMCSCVPWFYFTSWVSQFICWSFWKTCLVCLSTSESSMKFTLVRFGWCFQSYSSCFCSTVSKEEGWGSEAEAEAKVRLCSEAKKGGKKGGNKLKLKLWCIQLVNIIASLSQLHLHQELWVWALQRRGYWD